jgi:hypothetical protein
MGTRAKAQKRKEEEFGGTVPLSRKGSAIVFPLLCVSAPLRENFGAHRRF